MRRTGEGPKKSTHRGLPAPAATRRVLRSGADTLSGFVLRATDRIAQVNPSA